MKYYATFGMLFGCKRDVARVAGKVGGLTDCVFTGLCGALHEAKGKGGGVQVAYSKVNRGMRKVSFFLVAASLLMMATNLTVFAQQPYLPTMNDSVDNPLKTNYIHIYIDNEIEFFPKEFHDVRLGYWEGRKAITSPNTHSLWNEIVINVPSKIIYTIHDKFSFTPVIPVCSRNIIGVRRALRYYSSPRMLHIRKVGDSIWYSGEVVRPINRDIVLSDGTIVQIGFEEPPPVNVVEERELQQRRLEAQNYTDEEIDRREGQGFGGYMNLNLMEYVDLSLETGVYEIYMSFFGLQSNRAIVEINFIEEKVLPLPYE